ncbi:MFS general substrate transporter-58 [Coleophoma crateriformis]|uniref:MFS general substrate transporter-58 n=1 Tax=Coleophoma crateriformis TaxID=565419 RepID=A0A3D8QIZ5_9HELO|nr:MFS general substrate transporter-58 [Coleophoma crateriformis]
MQSFIQYRKFSLAVRKQVQEDREKAVFCLSPELHIPESLVRDHRRTSLSSSTTCPAENTAEGLERANSATSARTQYSKRHTVGHFLTGIHARDRTTNEGKGGIVFVVNWEGDDDPLNPRNWGVAYRVWVTLIVASIAFVVGAASSTDTGILTQAAAEFGVSEVVESMTTGLYLAGFGVGAVFAGPFSETFGRNAVYISTMVIFMMFIMAAALAPNIGAQLAFRFLAGAFGATPLTCAGGSISDMWPSLEKTFAFPMFAISAFGGPVLGPVIGSYIMNIGTWRWSEWIILIISAFVLGLVVFFQPETFPPLLLQWKAKHLRDETGDHRFRAEIEIMHISLWMRLKIALTRPLKFALEPIVVLMTLYMTVLYIVLFTFLDGYPHIFQKVYKTSQGLTNVIFTVPWVYKITKECFVKQSFVPEVRLWFAMLGAPAIPISLFWMGWTDYASISIWSPIMASVLFGYGLICIFMTAYMYLIDSYEIYAASALTFVTFTRYVTAGGMTVVGVPFYNNMGPHWTLTILGCISLLMVPIPYVFYKYGHIIRRRSQYAVSWN